MFGLGVQELMIIGIVFVFLVVGAGVILGLASRNTAGHPAHHDDARLTRLEQKVDAIARQIGLDERYSSSSASGSTTTYTNYGALDATRSGDGFDEEIKRLIRSGRKIEAIKLYRERFTGVGLKDAKDAVEAIEREMR